MDKSPITVEVVVNAPLEKVWTYWTAPEHIDQWNQASDDWASKDSKTDVRTGGAFSSIMYAKDGSGSFEFGGTYSNVVPNELIEYSMSDGRKVSVRFTVEGDSTKVIETFDPEGENTRELQQSGWQAILDNFKKHVESN